MPVLIYGAPSGIPLILRICGATVTILVRFTSKIYLLSNLSLLRNFYRFSSLGCKLKIGKNADFNLWCTQRDSNLQSLPSEGNALSSYAMGALRDILHYLTRTFNNCLTIKSPRIFFAAVFIAL